MDYATLKILKQWRNNYSRICGNLDVLPDAPRQLYRKHRTENNQKQKSFVSMLNSQHTGKKNKFENQPNESNWLCPLDNEDHHIGHCPCFVRLIMQKKSTYER